MDTIQPFFVPVKKDQCLGKHNYGLLSQYIETLQVVSILINLDFYIVDHQKQEFLYVSENSLFLSGYEQGTVKAMGYHFYSKVIPKDDLKLLVEINEKIFDFFYQLPVKQRAKASVSYDFRLRHKKGNIVLIHQKSIPLILTENGNVRFSLCLVSLSGAEKPGSAFIALYDEKEKYFYDPAKKNFTLAKNEYLTERECSVLRLMAQGRNANEIAEILFVSVNTVKYHKRNVLRKLNVKNTMEAIYYATVNKII